MLLHLDEASFDSQRHSLQQLTLCGVSGNFRVMNLGWHLVALPALRCLAIQNLGVTNLSWLESGWDSGPAGPLQSLALDNNAALQLDAQGAAALLNLTALKKLSMCKTAAPTDASMASTAGGVWSADSVRYIARVVAARPALQLCF